MQNNVGKYNLHAGIRVQHLDESIEGELVAIHKSTATLRDDDGFEYEFELTKLIPLPGQHEQDGLKEAVFSESIETKEENQRPKPSVKRDKGQAAIPEFDLHFDKLLEFYPQLNKRNILDYQLDFDYNYHHQTIHC